VRTPDCRSAGSVSCWASPDRACTDCCGRPTTEGPLFLGVELLPLVPAARRHQAAALLERVAKARRGLDGLGPRVDGAVRRLGSRFRLGPVRDQARPSPRNPPTARPPGPGGGSLIEQLSGGLDLETLMRRLNECDIRSGVNTSPEGLHVWVSDRAYRRRADGLIKRTAPGQTARGGGRPLSGFTPRRCGCFPTAPMAVSTWSQATRSSRPPTTRWARFGLPDIEENPPRRPGKTAAHRRHPHPAPAIGGEGLATTHGEEAGWWLS